ARAPDQHRAASTSWCRDLGARAHRETRKPERDTSTVRAGARRIPPKCPLPCAEIRRSTSSMRATILLQELLRLQQTQVQGFEFTETGLVVDVAPQTRSPHCAGCCRRCRRGYGGRER